MGINYLNSISIQRENAPLGRLLSNPSSDEANCETSTRTYNETCQRKNSETKRQKVLGLLAYAFTLQQRATENFEINCAKNVPEIHKKISYSFL